LTTGFYSPLPPERTGVADYAAALLPALRRHGDVRCAPPDCDVALYHVGNNPLHAEIYRRALAVPGIVVLHDAVLHHFLLGQLSREQYIAEFVYNYGQWYHGLARELWESRAASGSDSLYFQYPMLKRIADRSRAVIVHNAAAARAVKDHAPQIPVIEIPHFFAPPELPAEVETLRYRARLGFPGGGCLFGVFGYLRESKRLSTVLDTFRALHREAPQTGLLVAGAFVSPALKRACKPLLDMPGVACRPHLSAREFWLAASAVDACINLRDPSAGETSGIAIRMMGIGKAVLVTDSEECAGFPELTCLRIAAGTAERDSLMSHMLLITSLPGVGCAIGEQGAGHIRKFHDLDWAAQKYWTALCEYRC
jgi:hypothetical protein